MGYTFCIAGTQKSATTSLSRMLDKHPNVRRAPKKEMHFFDREDRDWDDPDYSDLRRTARRDHLALGDASPSYLWWPRAMQRIRAYNPGMRFLVTFRDPIDRLFSQWNMNVKRNPTKALDWPDFISTLAPDRLEERIPHGVDLSFYRKNSGIVRGYYGQQLERGYELFDRGQFHLLEFNAFLADHCVHLDRVTAFLGLPPFESCPELPHQMRGSDTAIGTAPTAADIELLVARYQEDFERFVRLSGLDVSAWSLRRLIDGTLSPADVAARYARKIASRDGST